METWPSGWRMPDLEPYYKEAEALFHITETPSRDGRHYLDNTGAGFARTALEKAGFVHSSDLTKRLARCASRPSQQRMGCASQLPRSSCPRL